MNSVGNIRISQIPPIETLTAKVLVTFDVFGPILPDTVVQIYASGRSDTISEADFKKAVDLNTTDVSYTATLDLQAGTAFLFHLCPRTVTDGVPDPIIDGQSFEAFCTFNIPFTTKALQPPAPPPPVPGPPPVSGAPDIVKNLRADVVSFSHIKLTWHVGGVGGFIRVHRLEGPSHVETQNFKLEVNKIDFTLDDRGLSPLTNYFYEVESCFGDDHNLDRVWR